jgi:hypothetical protein
MNIHINTDQRYRVYELYFVECLLPVHDKMTEMSFMLLPFNKEWGAYTVEERQCSNLTKSAQGASKYAFTSDHLVELNGRFARSSYKARLAYMHLNWKVWKIITLNQ